MEINDDIMLPILRRSKIKEIIYEEKSVSVSKLSKEFGVTEETIRRDLQELENEGILKRIYGGAYINDMVQSDVDVSLREQILVEEKELIANRCANEVLPGNSVFLDASTTSLYIALKIKHLKITVITNSLKIANILEDSPSIHLVLTGGIYNQNSMSFLGKGAENSLSNLFVDKAFVSCRSIHINTGITDSNEQQAEVRRLAIKHSNQAYLVVDHTKFDSTAFSFISDFDDISYLVTDKKINNEWDTYLREKNVIIIDDL